MRKHIFGKQLQRDTKERKALFKSLISALVVEESIQTTEAKAKAIKGLVEKLVTKARVGGVAAERAVAGYFTPSIMKKFIQDIAPRFKNRPGGYTRIVRLGHRFNDDAKMVILEWVEKPVKAEVVSAPKTEKVEAAKPVEKSTKKTTPVKKATKSAKKETK